jgi:hypothetical protein
LGFVVCFSELNSEVIMELQELNSNVCKLFGIDAGSCVKLTIEFSPTEPPRATAEMLPAESNDEIITTLDGFKHLVKSADDASAD